MKILGLIPARGGSKGVPGKNIKKLGNQPLIAYSIRAALDSNLTDVIVSTDDFAIANLAKEFGASVPFERPASLATDSASSIDVAMHALEEMEIIKGEKYDGLMLLQPTAPFRSTEDINLALDLLNSNPEAESVISVVDVKGHHPARMKFLEKGRLVDPPFCEKYENQNRQELIPMYIRNGAIYLSKRDIILSRSFKGSFSLAYVMPEERSVNIDTLSDFAMAEWVLKSNNI
jgi:CMP-N,N'-diacetyllegionaminic acid synthase